ncbi:hypothetical protein E2986_14145 [Frieseomelitta varia]|uniref:Uncharacterized protein n=1 Tax=Frieseomelitta varia TaxID=561572 RepID=A0A833VP27_9HYME|nr:hypothetical protein E2986_14145 [Frieseomelitta varia]
MDLWLKGSLMGNDQWNGYYNRIEKSVENSSSRSSRNEIVGFKNQKDEYISQNGHVRGLLVSTTSDAREESLVEEAREAEDYGGTLITKQLTLWKLI